MYKINDKIFYMKIDEQVEYLTQLINEIDEEYKDSTTALDSRITALETKSKEFDEAFTLVNEKLSTLESTEKAHYEEVLASIAEQATTFQSKINNLKSELEQEIALKQNINDDTLKTTSKKIVGAINENKDTIDSNKTELENKIAVKQDMTDNKLKTNTKTIVGAINEVFDKESTGVAIDEKTITLTDNNAIQVNPDILTKSTLNIITTDNILPGSINILNAPGSSTKTEIVNDLSFKISLGETMDDVCLGFGFYRNDHMILFTGTENSTTPGYINATDVVNIANSTEYKIISPFVTFDLVKELFTPIGYVMASTQATVPVYWGTWQQIGYTTINSVKIYYYKRTA